MIAGRSILAFPEQRNCSAGAYVHREQRETVDPARGEPAVDRTGESFGIYPRKGALHVGSDADLVLFSPDESWTLDSHSVIPPRDIRRMKGWR
jgi:hypothetical protein